jgi:predicted amidohydrolase
MKFKIAVVQFDVERLAPEANLQKAEEFIQKASREEAGIIIFPEDFVTDPLIDRLDFADYSNQYRKHFQHLAKKYSIDIVPGSVIEQDQKELFNTTYYINAAGDVLSRYRKVNLWLPERSYISPGHEIPVFDTQFGKVGLIICWDIAFPEMFRRMVQKGVEIVICPSYWCYGDAGKGIKIDPSSEIKLLDAMAVVRAYENEVIFVYCNAAGESGKSSPVDTLIGHSQITAPIKGCMKKLDHSDEEMFVEEVDTVILDIAEESKKIRDDLQNRVLI